MFHDRYSNSEILAHELSLQTEKQKTLKLQRQLQELEQQVQQNNNSHHQYYPSSTSSSFRSNNSSTNTSPQKRSPKFATTPSPTNTSPPPQRPFVTSSLGTNSKHYGGIHQNEKKMKFNQTNEEWRRKNRLRAINIAETNLKDSGRALTSLKRDMAREIDLFQHSIDKRQQTINKCHTSTRQLFKSMHSIKNKAHSLNAMINKCASLFSIEHETHAPFVKLQTHIHQVLFHLSEVEEGKENQEEEDNEGDDHGK